MLKITKIISIASNDCGGFQKAIPHHHLDTQMFPECEKYNTNRDVVKKTTDKRKKKKKNAKK